MRHAWFPKYSDIKGCIENTRVRQAINDHFIHCELKIGVVFLIYFQIVVYQNVQYFLSDIDLSNIKEKIIHPICSNIRTNIYINIFFK